IEIHNKHISYNSALYPLSLDQTIRLSLKGEHHERSSVKLPQLLRSCKMRQYLKGRAAAFYQPARPQQIHQKTGGGTECPAHYPQFHGCHPDTGGETAVGVCTESFLLPGRRRASAGAYGLP